MIPGDTVESALQRADAAMYENKRASEESDLRDLSDTERSG